MRDTLFIILVLVVSIGGLVGVAYFLDRRGKKSKSFRSPLPGPGPTGRILLWIARILVVIMVLSIIGAFVLSSLSLAWLTASCLFLYIVDGIVYRVVRTTGR